MTRLVVDAALSAKLAEAPGAVELCDPSGRFLGYFQPFYQPKDPEEARALTPFTDEEIERRRKNRSGRPLREILDDLEKS
jgi:hypothetical protein